MNSPSQEIRRRLRMTLLAALLAGGVALHAHDGTLPPAFDYAVETSATGGCNLQGDQPGAGGSTVAASATALARFPFARRGWYATIGAQVDRYAFTAGPVARLQDVTATFGVEYYRGGEKAASVTARPGLYFGDRAMASAGDVPIDAITGVPLAGGVNGVLGCSNARFYHHPLPIFGIVWDASPRLHVQLVYPETKVEYTLDRRTVLRLGGELVGGGFLVDMPGKRGTPVEYTSYRVGLGISRVLSAHCRLTVAAGIEAIRNFDAFRAGRREHSSGAPYLAVELSSGD